MGGCACEGDDVLAFLWVLSRWSAKKQNCCTTWVVSLIVDAEKNRKISILKNGYFVAVSVNFRILGFSASKVVSVVLKIFMMTVNQSISDESGAPASQWISWLVSGPASAPVIEHDGCAVGLTRWPTFPSVRNRCPMSAGLNPCSPTDLAEAELQCSSSNVRK